MTTFAVIFIFQDIRERKRTLEALALCGEQQHRLQ
jgi:hypothetical protein